ncbi:hypothetical protein HZS_3615 [Henneguya salminicola]|nr:hypothetical protein HZS_3615 [Henneguya salminicola]
MHDDENEINEYLICQNIQIKYQSLIRFLNQKYNAKAIIISSKNQVYNRIGYLRGPSTETLLTSEIQPRNFTFTGRPFLQRSWTWNIDGEFQRFLMWSSNEGLAIFRVTPHSFFQCLVVMSCDPSTNLLFPCVWALMSRRNEYLYYELFDAIIVN